MFDSMTTKEPNYETYASSRFCAFGRTYFMYIWMARIRAGYAIELRLAMQLKCWCLYGNWFSYRPVRDKSTGWSIVCVEYKSIVYIISWDHISLPIGSINFIAGMSGLLLFWSVGNIVAVAALYTHCIQCSSHSMASFMLDMLMPFFAWICIFHLLIE